MVKEKRKGNIWVKRKKINFFENFAQDKKMCVI